MSTKSLGTLTLDLVAKTGAFVQGMTKSQRSAQKWRRGVERDIKRVGTAMVGLGTLGAGAFSAMVVQTVNQAHELENLAEISDASNQSFQRLAYGASRFRVDQEKLGDILKTVNERIGEFQRDGSGEMAAFFENIAPKVGVTADQFARLSGPEALKLYVSSLENAGVSQKEMISYMEDLASDSSALIPLLANNGEEMHRLGDEAERTGNVFSELEFEQLGAIKQGMDELTGAATGMKNEMVLGALPAIDDMVELLSDPETLAAAQELGQAIVTAMGWAIEGIKDTISFAQNLGTELGVITAGIGGLELEEQRRRIMSALENPSERVRIFGPKGLITYHSEAELKAELERINQQIEQNAASLSVEMERSESDDLTIGGAISQQALEAAETVSSGLTRVAQSANDAADALDGFNPSMSDEVKGILDRAGDGATIDAQGQIRDAWGNTLPSLQRELDAELAQQVADFKSADNLQAGLDAAAQAFIDGAGDAAKAAWQSIQPAGVAVASNAGEPTGNAGSTPRRSTALGTEKVNQAASQIHASAGRHLGTLTLTSDKGGAVDVQGDGSELEQWLANTLSGVASAV